MLKTHFILLGFCIVLGFSGCSSQNTINHTLHYGKKSVLFPLPSRPCTSDFTGQSLLKFKWEQNQGSFFVIEKCAQGIPSIDGLLPTGLELFRITYDGKQVEYTEKVKSDRNIPVSEILFDSMAARIPAKELQENLPQGWTIQDEPSERRITDESGNPIEIIKWSQNSSLQIIRIINRAFGYEIEIQPLSVE